MSFDILNAMSKTLRPKRKWFPPDEFYAEEGCSRCGVCCGSTDGHACEHLGRDDGGYFCEIYADRLGPHHTLDGQSFVCVPIRRLIESNGGYACCDYVKEIMRLRETMGQDTSDLGNLEKP